MSTPTQTPAELAAAEIARDFAIVELDSIGNTVSTIIQDEAAKVIQAVIDTETKALIDSICQDLDLDAMEDQVLLEIAAVETPWPKTQARLRILTLVSRAKRAKEGKGV